MQGDSTLVLNYIIYNPRHKINLSLFEAEKYESAVVVQSLVGTLVFYSNFGRYEPRIATSWERIAPNVWEFHLSEKHRCENGEQITAESFKKSLERTVVIFAKLGYVPVLSELKGYNEFIAINRNKRLSEITSLAGIVADGNRLRFEFTKPVKSGLLQILSFSPFGYLSMENFNEDGAWRDVERFVSSGPYRVERIAIGENYTLTRNDGWPQFLKGSPEKIVIHHDSSAVESNTPVIVDAFTQNFSHEALSRYKLVPEYINSVLLGNLDGGYFSTIAARSAFKREFERIRDSILPLNFDGNDRSSAFYPTQAPPEDPILHKSREDLLATKYPLKIEGKEPEPGTPRHYAWKVLEKVLSEHKIPYVFSNTSGSFAEMTNRSYDIRIRGSSIGGGVEPWGLFVIFCSPFGINFPDPSGRVCQLVRDFENDEINEQQTAAKFHHIVEEDAAILPVSHFGINMYFSDRIDRSSVSPLLSVIRFDQLRID